jgi:hypothetical protein
MAAFLKIASTHIIERENGFVVEMALTSDFDLKTAQDWAQIRATLDTDERYPRLPKLQAIALRHVRDALTMEIQRLESLEGRSI